MNQHEQWLLPDGVDEVLPDVARAIEQCRRDALDMYQQWGYELVFPPLIEFLESLLNGSGRDLEKETFKITDQLTGRLMGIRADLTPQVARMDAHSLRRSGPTRLCYCSTSVRTRPAQAGGTRLPYQLGAELFGHAGVESDLEILNLMLATLALADLDQQVVVDMGHVGIFRALAQAADLSSSDLDQLEDIYLRKAKVELDAFLADAGLSAELTEALASLPWLAGGEDVIARARTVLASFPDALDAVDELATLRQVLTERGANVHLDLGELRGYHYHTGCVFAAYLPGDSEPVAKGGRYDHVGEVFGRARPATGFSVDLKKLAGCQHVPLHDGIMAIGSLLDGSFVAAVEQLRAQGERVVVALAGADNSAVELGCQRQLINGSDGWVIKAL